MIANLSFHGTKIRDRARTWLFYTGKYTTTSVKVTAARMTSERKFRAQGLPRLVLGGPELNQVDNVVVATITEVAE